MGGNYGTKLDELEVKAKKYNLLSPDEFFNKIDDEYAEYDMKETYKNRHKDKYVKYFDNSIAGREAMAEAEKLQKSNEFRDGVNPINAGLTSFAQGVPFGEAAIRLTSSPQEMENRRRAQEKYPTVSTGGAVAGNVAGGVALGGGVAGGVGKVLPKLKPIGKALVVGVVTGGAMTATTEGIREGFEAAEEGRDYDVGKIAKKAGINAGSNVVAVPVQHAAKLKPLTRYIGGSALDAGANVVGTAADAIYAEGREPTKEELILSGALGLGMGLGLGYGGYKGDKSRSEYVTKDAPVVKAEPPKTESVVEVEDAKPRSMLEELGSVNFDDVDLPAQVIKQEEIKPKKQAEPKPMDSNKSEDETPVVKSQGENLGNLPKVLSQGDLVNFAAEKGYLLTSVSDKGLVFSNRNDNKTLSTATESEIRAMWEKENTNLPKVEEAAKVEVTSEPVDNTTGIGQSEMLPDEPPAVVSKQGESYSDLTKRMEASAKKQEEIKPKKQKGIKKLVKQAEPKLEEEITDEQVINFFENRQDVDYEFVEKADIEGKPHFIFADENGAEVVVPSEKAFLDYNELQKKMI